MSTHTRVLTGRYNKSLLWMVAVTLVLFDGFLFILKILSWHPFSGIQDWLWSLFSWRFLFFHLLLFVLLRVFAAFHMMFYSVAQHTCHTRWAIIRRTLSLQRICHLLVLSTLGCLNGFAFVLYIGIAAEVAKSPSFLETIFQVQGINAYTFLFFNGLFTGALFTWKYYANDWCLLKFSLIPQPKLTVLRSKFPEIFKESITDIMKSLHIFYISYMLLGPYLANRVLSLFSRGPSSLQVSVYEMMNGKLLLVAFIASVFMHVIWRIFIEIFNICLTERYEFKIDETPEVDKAEILIEALHCSRDVVKYLAHMDLRHVAQFSHSKRSLIFSISKPGGHPKHWLALSSHCLYRLTDFLNRLEQLVVYEKSCGLKMSLKKGAVENQLLQDNIIDSFFKYFVDTLPDSMAVTVFTTCQIEIWIIEALGFFLAAAYTEDRLGVVQQTLPKIISLLIDIKLCEEKLPITVLSFKKYAKDTVFLHKAITQRQILKSALESAIYRIVLAFKTDIRGVTLPEDHQQYLEKYLEFKR